MQSFVESFNKEAEFSSEKSPTTKKPPYLKPIQDEPISEVQEISQRSSSQIHRFITVCFSVTLR